MTVSNLQMNMDKLLLGVMVALLSWNVYTTHKLSVDVAVLANKVETLEEAVQYRINQSRSESNAAQS